MKILSAILVTIYIVDLLLKKFFGTSAVTGTGLPETGSYLVLFFAVGAFLFAILKLENDE
jgi:hypothetical protein